MNKKGRAMKILLIVIAGLFVAVGFLGRPYIEMLQDGQSLACVSQQIQNDIKGDDSLSGVLSTGADKLSCQADAFFD